jgi:hypothetical protein
MVKSLLSSLTVAWVIKSQCCGSERIVSEQDPDPASQKELRIEPFGIKMEKTAQFMQFHTH